MREVTFTGTLSGDNECFCYNITKAEYIRLFGEQSWNDHVAEEKSFYEDFWEHKKDIEPFQEPQGFRLYEMHLHNLIDIDGNHDGTVEVKLTLINKGPSTPDEPKWITKLRVHLMDVRHRFYHWPHDKELEGRIQHHINCRFYAHDDRTLNNPTPLTNGQKGGTCTCGLLHDLHYLVATGGGYVVDKIYPTYDKEYSKSNYYCDEEKPRRIVKELSQEEKTEFFKKIGMKYTPPTEEEIQEKNKLADQLIEEVFGKKYLEKVNSKT